MTTADVADLLKGPRGTLVKSWWRARAPAKPLSFNVIRDEISRKSVADAFWVKPGHRLCHDLEPYGEHQHGAGR